MTSSYQHRPLSQERESVLAANCAYPCKRDGDPGSEACRHCPKHARHSPGVPERVNYIGMKCLGGDLRRKGDPCSGQKLLQSHSLREDAVKHTSVASAAAGVSGAALIHAMPSLSWALPARRTARMGR